MHEIGVSVAGGLASEVAGVVAVINRPIRKDPHDGK
jgi:hypothetical protein